MGWIGFVGIILLLSAGPGYSQKRDTTRQSQRTHTLTQTHSPTKAALLSAALPGLGQVYNKKYWKIPILYAGGAFVFYLVDFYNDHYNEYNNAYSAFINNKIDEYNGITSEEGLKRAKDFYRRYRDLNIIIMAGVYLANIIDATVDAYLFNFDVSRNLSLQPTTLPAKKFQRVPAVSITVRF